MQYVSNMYLVVDNGQCEDSSLHDQYTPGHYTLSHGISYNYKFISRKNLTLNRLVLIPQNFHICVRKYYIFRSPE